MLRLALTGPAAVRRARSRCCCPMRRRHGTRRSTARSSRTASRSSGTTACCTRMRIRMPRSSSSRPSRRSPRGPACSCSTPSTSGAAVTIVAAANAQGVPVVSYDRLVAGGDLAYYVSFDNEKVGELQATAFVEALEARGAAGRRHPDGQRLAHRQQRDPVRRGCPPRDRRRGAEGARRVRDAGLEPRQGAGVGDRSDLAVRRRDRRRVCRQRRHRERRRLGPESGERRSRGRS